MAGFDIHSSDIDSMDSLLNGQSPVFILSTAALKKSIQNFIDIPKADYSGGGADSSRTYMQEVHLVMVEKAEQIYGDFVTEFNEYKKGYEEIETAASYKLNEGAMEDFRQLIVGRKKRIWDIFYDSKDAVKNDKDFGNYLVQESLTENIDSCISAMSSGIVNLCSEVNTHEIKTLYRLEQLKKAVTSFAKCVESIGAGTCSDPMNYTSGDFLKTEAFLELAEAEALCYLNANGITAGERASMAELGYSAADLRTVVASCETETDWQMLDYMLGRNDGYDGMFGIDPYGLSVDVNCILVDYTARLLKYKPEAFIDLNNELLGATDLYIYPDTGLYGDSKYRDIYLDTLSGYSLLMLVGELEVDCQSDWNVLLDAAGIWNTENMIIDTLSDPENFYLNCTDFNVKGIYDVDGEGCTIKRLELSFYSPFDKGVLDCKINIIEKLSPGELASTLKGMDISDLEKAASELSTMKGYLKILLKTAAGKLNPAVSVALLVNDIIYGFIGPLEELEKGSGKKWYSMFGMGVIFEIEDGLDNSVIDKLGLGEKNIALMGRYNPEVLEFVENWENNGLEWYGFSEEQKQEVTDWLEGHVDDEKLKRTCEDLVNGGFEMDKMDLGDFLDAIVKLNQIDGIKDLEGAWKRLVNDGKDYED